MIDRPPLAGLRGREAQAEEQLAAMTSALRSRRLFLCDTHLGEDVTLEMPALPGTIMFHLLLDGSCSLTSAGWTIEAGAGSIVLAPHGAGHSIGTGIRHVVALQQSGLVDLGGGIERLDLGEDPSRAHVICGALTLEHPAAPALPRALDPLVLVAHGNPGEQERIRVLTDVIRDEAAAREPGWALICRQLADALAVRAVRRAVASAPQEAGWWSAARTPRLARVLAAVQADPAENWTLELLARTAGMSRSAFAQLFTDGVGEAPMTWVGRQRMALASRLLASGASVSSVARRTGYGSEVSFRRAFRRITGTTPGAVRAGAEKSGRTARGTEPAEVIREDADCMAITSLRAMGHPLSPRALRC